MFAQFGNWEHDQDGDSLIKVYNGIPDRDYIG